MRPEVNSNRFEISNCFEMSFRLHGNLHRDFTAASFQTIARLYCTCANDIFVQNIITFNKNVRLITHVLSSIDHAGLVIFARMSIFCKGE